MPSATKDEHLQFRCTQGELKRLRNNVAKSGLTLHDYIHHSVMLDERDDISVDWSIVNDFLSDFVNLGMTLNEIAHDLNSIALMVGGGITNNTVISATVSNVNIKLFEIESQRATVTRALDPLARVCAIERDCPAPVQNKKTARVCVRMSGENVSMIREMAKQKGVNMTTLVLAKCVYKDTEPLYVNTEILDTIYAECSRQGNNCNQLNDATRRIAEQTKERGVKSPLSNGMAHAVTTLSNNVRFVVGTVLLCTHPLYRAATLSRYL